MNTLMGICGIEPVHCVDMFVSLPSRKKPAVRWATPALFATLWIAFLWATTRSHQTHDSLVMQWGALSGGMASPEAWLAALREGTALRLFTALFLHADWAHLLGNLVFLLIFGLPAERTMGPWRFLVLFLLGGAVANLAAVLTIGAPDRVIIGASGAVSAVIGAYLALFPTAKLGVVLPLGLFLEFVKAPASLLIGIWALLQVLFAYIGPAFGAVAWSAHIAGFLFGVIFALFVRAAIARRLRKRQGY
jgi:membrane associated rhomboid family serine protease